MTAVLLLYLGLMGQSLGPRDEREEPPSVSRRPAVTQGLFRPRAAGPVVSFGSGLTAPGRLYVRPLLGLSLVRGSFDSAGSFVPLPGNELLTRTSVTVFAEYGLSSRVALGGLLSGVVNSRSIGGSRVRSTGLSDLLLVGRLALAQEAPGGWPGLTLAGFMKLPTGNAEGAPERLGTDVTGTGSVDLSLGLNATKGLRPFLMHASLYYTLAFPARVAEGETRYAGALSWSVAAEWPFWPELFGLLLELSGRSQGAPVLGNLRQEGAELRELSFSGGLEVLVKPDFKLLLGYQRTLSGRNVRAWDSLLVAVVPTF